MIRLALSVIFVSSLFATEYSSTRLRFSIEPIPHYNYESTSISHANGWTTIGYKPVVRNFAFGIIQPVLQNLSLSLEIQNIVWTSHYVHEYDLEMPYTSDIIDQEPAYEVGTSDRLFGHDMSGPSIGFSYCLSSKIFFPAMVTGGVFLGYEDDVWYRVPYIRYEFAPIKKIKSLMISGQGLWIPDDGFIYSAQLSFSPRILFWR